MMINKFENFVNEKLGILFELEEHAEIIIKI